ncbi:MAG: MaoC family dehydratase [Nocardioidaceae bacterium]|nr:MaoC family dehydratase [Nocardioidaceae bacterium]
MPNPHPRGFTDLKALTAAVGDDLGVSDWLTIDQPRIDAFAEATGDRQCTPADVDRAAQRPHASTIAHSYLVLSLLPALVASIVSYDGWPTRLNYGSNKVRYPAPVTCGSRVRAQATLVAVTPTSAGLQVTTRVTLEHEYGGQLQPRPALVADVLTLLVD